MLRVWVKIEAKLKNQSRLFLFAFAMTLALSVCGCEDISAVRPGESRFSNPADYSFVLSSDVPVAIKYSPIVDSLSAAKILHLDSMARVEKKDSPKFAVKKVKVLSEPVDSTAVASEEPASLDTVPEIDPCGNVGLYEICDSRDGKHYDYVTIGKQTWFKRNLNYETEGSWCPDNHEENCKLYGRLYQWNVANSCPEGWHLPSMREFTTLYSYISSRLGNKEGVGTSLKVIVGWNEDVDDNFPRGTNRFGFSAKPAGYRDDRGNFLLLGEEANFWTSNEIVGDDRAAYWNLYYGNQDFIGSYVGLKSSAMSVRCIKNSEI